MNIKYRRPFDMKDIILMQIIPVLVFIAVFAGVIASFGPDYDDPSAVVLSFFVGLFAHTVVFFAIGEIRMKQELKKIK